MSIYLLFFFFKIGRLLLDVKTEELYLSFHIPLSLEKNDQCGICSFPNLSNDDCIEIVECSPYTTCLCVEPFKV